VFAFSEEVFDEVPFFVDMLVILSGRFPVFSGWNDRDTDLSHDLSDELLAILSLVSNNKSSLRRSDKFGGLCDIVALSWGQRDCERPPNASQTL
jgi:hypothetical protein